MTKETLILVNKVLYLFAFVFGIVFGLIALVALVGFSLMETNDIGLQRAQWYLFQNLGFCAALLLAVSYFQYERFVKFR